MRHVFLIAAALTLAVVSVVLVNTAAPAQTGVNAGISIGSDGRQSFYLAKSLRVLPEASEEAVAPGPP